MKGNQIFLIVIVTVAVILATLLYGLVSIVGIFS